MVTHVHLDIYGRGHGERWVSRTPVTVSSCSPAGSVRKEGESVGIRMFNFGPYMNTHHEINSPERPEAGLPIWTKPRLRAAHVSRHKRSESIMLSSGDMNVLKLVS